MEKLSTSELLDIMQGSSVVFIILMTVGALWVWLRYDREPGVLGFTGALAAVVTGVCWFHDLHAGVAVLVALASIACFIMGMFVNKHHDEIWHVMAFGLGVLGKLLLWLLWKCGQWLFTADEISIPRLVWLVLIVIPIAYAAYRWYTQSPDDEAEPATA